MVDRIWFPDNRIVIPEGCKKIQSSFWELKNLRAREVLRLASNVQHTVSLRSC